MTKIDWQERYNEYVDKKVLAYRQYQELKSLLYQEFMNTRKKPKKEEKVK